MSETPLPKILIVDDESVLVRTLCKGLGRLGYQTAGFTSPNAALEELQKTEFDLLLTDLMMPEMDGIELFQAASKKQPRLVGVIMTGQGTIATAVEAMKSGALDYILKPFELETILPVLERALEVRRLRLQNEALALQVRERTAQLEAANQELEAFTYSVSHDLRAPVRHIGSFANLLRQSEPALSETGRRYLDLVAGSAKRMAQIIDSLLELSRNSRAKMHCACVNLPAMVDEIILRLRPETEGRNISWKTGALPEVQADAALLQQAITNLLHNAVKYTRYRNPAEIEIGCLNVADNEITVFVRDNGAGFDMKHADRLFGAFQRLHPDDEFEGTGIGLANVRRIIARHGGRTWAEGKVNAGATFYFTLPK